MIPFLFLLRFSVLALFRQRWVFLLTLLGVSTGTAVVSAVLLANNSALRSFKNAISHVQGKTDYTIRSPAGVLFSDRVLDRLNRSLPAPDFEISPLLTRTVRYRGQIFWVRGVDILGSIDRVSRHSSFKVLTEGAAFLPPGGLSRLGIRKGETIKVLFGTRIVSIPIAGEIPPSSSVSLIPSNTLFMDLAWAQMRFGASGKLSRIDLRWKAVPLLAPERDLLKRVIASRIGPGLSLVSEAERHKEFSRLLFSYRSNLFALSLVSLIVGMFLIYNTLSLLTLQNRRQFSTMRLLGATPAEIRGIVLLQGLFVGCLGGGLGILFGHFLSRLTVGAVSRTLDTLYLPVGILPGFQSTRQDLELWALTIVASLFSAIFPSREAVRVQPILSQNRIHLERAWEKKGGKRFLVGMAVFVLGILFLNLPPVHGFPLFGYLGALVWVFAASLSLPLCIRGVSTAFRTILELFPARSPVVELALSHFRFGISRSGIAISSVMVGLAMMTGIVILVHSFEQTLNLWISQNLVADLYVKPLSCRAAVCGDILGANVVNAIRELPGVDFVARYASFPARYRGRSIWIGFSEIDRVRKRAPLSLMTSHPRQVLDAFDQGQGVLVSESFSFHSGKKPGDLLTLPSPGGPITVRILSLYHDYSSESGVVLFPYFQIAPLFDSHHVTNLSIFLKPGQPPDPVMETILHSLPGSPKLFVRSQPELKRRVLRIFHQSFAITYALLGISLAVSVIGVGNTLLMLLYEREREFALMRSLGFLLTEIRTILVLEAFFMGVTGTILGLLLGTGVGWIIVHIINRQAFGWTILWTWPAGTVLSLTFILLFVATAASLLPSLLLNRQRSSDREE
ncbi:MAG: FtsX-like permease family protein [Leptospirales bacterium]